MSRAADVPTIRARTITTVPTAPESTVGTTGTVIRTTATITRIFIIRHIMAGPTIRGRRRIITDGDGAELRGTGTTGDISPRIPCILRPHSGSQTI